MKTNFNELVNNLQPSCVVMLNTNNTTGTTGTPRTKPHLPVTGTTESR
jgi:hypothetical protein